MDTLTAPSGRTYTALPIDTTRGFPQGFPFLFHGQTYQFRLYVNVAAGLLDGKDDFIELPTELAFLVVRVERENADGSRERIFVRKVVPDLEYAAEDLLLYFPPQPRQLVARQNLNGQGEFGSRIVGGIAPRWE